jgi:hypothetical protein
MKKMLLCAIIAVAVSTTVNAQEAPKPSITYHGLNLTLNCQKKMTLICRQQTSGYIDSNQISASHKYTYTSKTEFHTKNAVETFRETLSENRLKFSASASTTFDYGAGSGEAKAGFESDYFNKLQASVKTNSEQMQDLVTSEESTFDVAYKPGTAIQLYECVISVPGEYERVYASPKVPNQTKWINYTINFDYTNPIRDFYKTVKETSVGADTGEWSELNGIANEAYTQYGDSDEQKVAIWKKFLTELATKLWTDGSDQGSWAILKNAANSALQQKEPVNQLRYFCSQVKNIQNPSHNDWAWARITNFAKEYDF